MIPIQDILGALEEQYKKIHRKLGPAWSDFHHELAPVLACYADVTDWIKLNTAAEHVWQVCCRYPPVESILVEHMKQRPRRPEPPREKGDKSIFEIANRFQSLLARLEEMESVEEDERRGRMDKTSEKKADAHDRRTHT